MLPQALVICNTPEGALRKDVRSPVIHLNPPQFSTAIELNDQEYVEISVTLSLTREFSSDPRNRAGFPVTVASIYVQEYVPNREIIVKKKKERKGKEREN